MINETKYKKNRTQDKCKKALNKFDKIHKQAGAELGQAQLSWG